MFVRQMSTKVTALAAATRLIFENTYFVHTMWVITSLCM